MNKYEDFVKETKEEVVKRLKNKEQLMILLTPKRDDNVIQIEIFRYRVEPKFVDAEINTEKILNFIQPKTDKNFAILLTTLLTDKIQQITGKDCPSYLLENIEKAFIDGKLNEIYDYYKTFVEDNFKGEQQWKKE